MQLEIVYELRNTSSKADITGEKLAVIVQEFIAYNDWDEPNGFETKEI